MKILKNKLLLIAVGLMFLFIDCTSSTSKDATIIGRWEVKKIESKVPGMNIETEDFEGLQFEFFKNKECKVVYTLQGRERSVQWSVDENTKSIKVFEKGTEDKGTLEGTYSFEDNFLTINGKAGGDSVLMHFERIEN